LILEKSGAWNSSVLGWANGLDAGSVADVTVEALCVGRVAAAAGTVATAASAVAARRSLLVMSLENL
jgi:hypothetical protein